MTKWSINRFCFCFFLIKGKSVNFFDQVKSAIIIWQGGGWLRGIQKQIAMLTLISLNVRTVSQRPLPCWAESTFAKSNWICQWNRLTINKSSKLTTLISWPSYISYFKKMPHCKCALRKACRSSKEAFSVI